MIECPSPGIYPLVPFSVYCQWDAINPGFLTTLAQKTPYHAKRNQDHPAPDTDDKRVGRALHSFILEPATFDQFWIVLPEDPPRRPSERQRNAKSPSDETVKAIDFWDAVAESGRDAVKATEYALVKDMALEIRRQQCVEHVSGGQAEVSIVWNDPGTGLLCKSRLDYQRAGSACDWNPSYITDLKSSRDITPERFSQDLAKFGYALAAAMRIDGWREATRAAGRPPEDSIYNLLAVDKGYCVSWVKQIDDDTIAAGRNHYQGAIKTAAECIKSGVWLAYGTGVGFIGAPAWYLSLHGVGRDRVYATGPSVPEYVAAREADVSDDEFDQFLKGEPV